MDTESSAERSHLSRKEMDLHDAMMSEGLTIEEILSRNWNWLGTCSQPKLAGMYSVNYGTTAEHSPAYTQFFDEYGQKFYRRGSKIEIFKLFIQNAKIEDPDIPGIFRREYHGQLIGSCMYFEILLTDPRIAEILSK